MAASDSLHPQLFSGTAGHVRGGVINPSLGLTERAAYASNSIDLAEYYARQAAGREGTLFGTVYEVAPVSKAEYIRGTLDEDDPGAIFGDPVGLKIGKAVSFPINPHARPVHPLPEEPAKPSSRRVRPSDYMGDE